MTTAPHPPALLVFADDWGRHPSSCQHLVRRLLGRHEVHWVNTIGMRAPRFDLATVTRGLEKLAQWARPAEEPAVPLPANLHVLNPGMWPWFRTRLDRRLNGALLARQLAPTLRGLPAPPIAITTLPIVADLIGRLPVARWVYYCVDDFGHWPGMDQAALRKLEEPLIRKADLLIAASAVLQSKLIGHGRFAHLLPHGVDLEHWRVDGPAPGVPELEGLPRPLVLFWGLIDRRLDVAFLRRLAADLTAGTIVLVGPQADPDPALAQIDRLVRLPATSYERLPHLAHQADVLIMPYADLPVTRAIQPLKMGEYLATGKPTVARNLPATRAWADALDLAGTPEAFSQAVRHRLEAGLTAPQREARVRLDAESWDAKAELFQHWITGHAPLEAGPPTPRKPECGPGGQRSGATATGLGMCRSQSY